MINNFENNFSFEKKKLPLEIEEEPESRQQERPGTKKKESYKDIRVVGEVEKIVYRLSPDEICYKIPLLWEVFEGCQITFLYFPERKGKRKGKKLIDIARIPGDSNIDKENWRRICNVARAVGRDRYKRDLNEDKKKEEDEDKKKEEDEQFSFFPEEDINSENE